MHRPLLLAALTCFFACSSSSSLRYPDPPPPGGDILPQTTSVTIMQHLLDTLEVELPTLLSSLHESTLERDRIRFDLDETMLAPGGIFALRDGCAGTPTDTGCSSPTPISSVSLSPSNLSAGLQLSWLPNDRSGRPGIHVSLKNAEVFVDLSVAIARGVFWPAATCRVQDSSPQHAAISIREITFDIRLALPSPGAPIVSEVQNATVISNDLQSNVMSHLRISPSDDAICAADPASCDLMCGLGNNLSQLGLVSAVLQPMINNMAPMLSEAVTDALATTLETVSSQFIDRSTLHDDNAFYSWFNLTHLQDGLHSGIHGLDLNLDSGFAAAPDRCVPAHLSAPHFADAGPAPTLAGFVDRYVIAPDGRTVPTTDYYDLAVTLALPALEQAAWNAFQGGGLCFTARGDELSQSSTFGVALNGALLMTFDPSLEHLFESDTPLMISLRPTQAPRLQLGAGRVLASGIYDPLIKLGLDNVEISIYVFSDDAQLRLGTVTTDLDMGFDIVPRAEHGMEMSVHHVTLNNVQQEYNELAPLTHFDELIQFVADVLLGQMLATDPNFGGGIMNGMRSSANLGLELFPVAARREIGPSGTPFLAAYFAACGPESFADPMNGLCQNDMATVSALSLSSAEYSAPTQQLIIHSNEKMGQAYEYQSRVDNGYWTSFSPAVHNQIAVNSARLWAPGMHRIEMRARPLGTTQRAKTVGEFSVTIEEFAAAAAAQPTLAASSPTTSEAASCNAVGPQCLGLLSVLAALIIRRKK